MTGLAIAASGCLGMRGPDGHLLDGVASTAAAFKTVLGPFADAVISISMFCFAKYRQSLAGLITEKRHWNI